MITQEDDNDEPEKFDGRLAVYQTSSLRPKGF